MMGPNRKAIHKLAAEFAQKWCVAHGFKADGPGAVIMRRKFVSVMIDSMIETPIHIKKFIPIWRHALNDLIVEKNSTTSSAAADDHSLNTIQRSSGTTR